MLEMIIAGGPAKLPGSDTFIGEYIRPDGTGHTGYYGVVAPDEFITLSQLKSATGVTGQAVVNETSWLKFYIDGAILYVAKTAVVHSMNWEELNARGVIFGGKIITIKGQRFKVRSFKTLGPGISAGGSIVAGNEWDRLLSNVSTEGLARQEGGKWASFTPGELGLNANVGSFTICQEYNTNTSGQVWVRGLNTVGGSGGVFSNQSNTYTYMGWRPVLELIQP